MSTPSPASCSIEEHLHVVRAGDSDEVRHLRSRLQYFQEKAIRLDERVFQMRMLLQSGKGFSEILNLESLLDAFMAVCRERYGALSSAVLLLDDLDPENVFYRVRAHHGLPESYTDRDGHEEELLLFRIPQDDGLLWQVIQQGEAFSVRDMLGRPRFRTAFERWGLGALHASVWLPLIRGGQVLGILTLGECDEASPIHEWDYSFLEEIAAVAATNIDSTLKYEKNARILSNLRTLYDVNQQLANVNDFKQLTIQTLATAVDALKAQKANLMLYNPETRRLEIKVVWGSIPKHTRDAINGGRMETRSFLVGEGVAGMAAQRQRPVRRNDRSKIEQVSRNTVYCILSVPLIHGGKVVGVMTLTNKVKRNAAGEEELDTLGRFCEEDEQLLLGLADQAAVNLHKARLYSASITDRLTGLYNARHFETFLEARLHDASDDGEPVALAVTDIDHFKRFNDRHGHAAGDFVLAEVSRVLRESCRQREVDACFRYGGEEFCVVLPGVDSPTAVAIMDRFRAEVASRRFEYEGETLSVTVSVGLACYPEHGHDRRSLFESADRALYAAKHAGRNCVMKMVDGEPSPVTDVPPSAPRLSRPA